MQISSFQPRQIRSALQNYNESHLNWNGKIDDSERKILPRSYQQLQISDEMLGRGHAFLRDSLESGLQHNPKLSAEDLSQSLLERQKSFQASAALEKKTYLNYLTRNVLGTTASVLVGCALASTGPLGALAGTVVAGVGSRLAGRGIYHTFTGSLMVLGAAGVYAGLAPGAPAGFAFCSGVMGALGMGLWATTVDRDVRWWGHAGEEQQTQAEGCKTAREVLLPAWEKDLQQHPNRQNTIDALSKRGLSAGEASSLVDQAEKARGLYPEEGYDALVLLAGRYPKGADISNHFDKFANLVEGGLSPEMSHRLLRSSLADCADPREAESSLHALAGVSEPLAEGVLGWTKDGAGWSESANLAASVTARAQDLPLEARTQDVLSYPAAIWPHHNYSNIPLHISQVAKNAPGIPVRSRPGEVQKQVFTPPYLWEVQAAALENGFDRESSLRYAAVFSRDIQNTVGQLIADTLREPEIQQNCQAACDALKRLKGADGRTLEALDEVLGRYRSEQALEAFATLQEKLDPAERTAVAILFKDTLLASAEGNKVSPALSAQALVDMVESGQDSRDAITKISSLLKQCETSSDPNRTFQHLLSAAKD